MASFYDRVKMGVAAAPGTGPVTLGIAAPGFRSFAAAAVTDGGVVSYVIEDGATWEVGHGTYAATGTVLTRTTVIASSNGDGSPINASASASVYLTLLAEDIASFGSGGSGGSGGSTGVLPTIVQSAFGSTADSTVGTNMTLAAAPTPGNLLVVVAMVRGDTTVKSGWNLVSNVSGTESPGTDAVIATRKVLAGDAAHVLPFLNTPAYLSEVYEVSGVNANDLVGASTIYNTKPPGGASGASITISVPADTMLLGASMCSAGHATNFAVTNVTQDASFAAYLGDYAQIITFHQPVVTAESLTITGSHVNDQSYGPGDDWLAVIALSPPSSSSGSTGTGSTGTGSTGTGSTGTGSTGTGSTGTGSTGTGSTGTGSSSSGSATSAHSYWRILVLDTDEYPTLDAGGFVTFAGLDFYDTSGAVIPATGGVAFSVNENGSYPVSALFDGDPSTIASTRVSISDYEHYYAGYMFASPTIVGSVKVTASTGYTNHTPHDFAIQYSDNGFDWLTAVSVFLTGAAWASGEVRTYQIVSG